MLKMTKKNTHAKKPRHPPSRRQKSDGKTSLHLYGLHAVEMALQNPERHIYNLRATQNAAERLKSCIEARNPTAQIVSPKEIEKYLGPDAVHQGVLLDVAPLPTRDLEEFEGETPILVLDQVTDPHNVGAILRSCATFGAKALVMTARHSPPLSGALAKAASGGLEHVPVVLVANLAQALNQLGKMGFWRLGLDGGASERLEDVSVSGLLALVLGAEGKGLRRLTREHCDTLCKISATGHFSSLNVSNAAAVSLYHIQRKTLQK